MEAAKVRVECTGSGQMPRPERVLTSMWDVITRAVEADVAWGNATDGGEVP